MTMAIRPLDAALAVRGSDDDLRVGSRLVFPDCDLQPIPGTRDPCPRFDDMKGLPLDIRGEQAHRFPVRACEKALFLGKAHRGQRTTDTAPVIVCDWWT